MPKVAGTYQAIVKVRKVVGTVKGESKEAAIRKLILSLAKDTDTTDFEAWVNGGMEIELAPTPS